MAEMRSGSSTNDEQATQSPVDSPEPASPEIQPGPSLLSAGHKRGSSGEQLQEKRPKPMSYDNTLDEHIEKKKIGQ